MRRGTWTLLAFSCRHNINYGSLECYAVLLNSQHRGLLIFVHVWNVMGIHCDDGYGGSRLMFSWCHDHRRTYLFISDTIISFPAQSTQHIANRHTRRLSMCINYYRLYQSDLVVILYSKWPPRPILPKLFLDYFFEESGGANHFLKIIPNILGSQLG